MKSLILERRNHLLISLQRMARNCESVGAVQIIFGYRVQMRKCRIHQAAKASLPVVWPEWMEIPILETYGCSNPLITAPSARFSLTRMSVPHSFNASSCCFVGVTSRASFTNRSGRVSHSFILFANCDIQVTGRPLPLPAASRMPASLGGRWDETRYLWNSTLQSTAHHATRPFPVNLPFPMQ